jgi:hypothetical protein
LLLLLLLLPVAARFDARRDLEDVQAAHIPVVPKVRLAWVAQPLAFCVCCVCELRQSHHIPVRTMAAHSSVVPQARQPLQRNSSWQQYVASAYRMPLQAAPGAAGPGAVALGYG